MISNKPLLLIIFIFGFFAGITQSRSVIAESKPQFHSDSIVTYWPEDLKELNNEPGFMRTQLRRFGEMASKIGNAVGSGTSKITQAIDKVCEVVKTIIPLLTAVCHVGQFKFCAATMGAPEDLNQAISSGYADLNIPD